MKSVLLLRGVGRSLSDVESFLKSRGFRVDVVHRIPEAIQFITEHKPTYALLSADLIPPRSKWLFGILNQITHPILFAERISARTIAVSRELKDNHLVDPPLTPASFEQVFRRIERDQKILSHSASQLGQTQVWIMSALSDLALNSTCSPGKMGAGAETINRSKRITCFRAETSKLAGYFVLAYGQDRTLESDWTGKLQGELKKYLTTFDAKPTISPSEELVIQEVNFAEWSKGRAEFLRKAIHQDAELFMAFFKDQVEAVIQPSSKRGHVAVKLDQIPGNTVMDFDVYIYLPQNARFILYTPKGSTLYEKQKQKLLSEGIQSVHIPKRFLNEIRQHQTRSFVEESAAQFRSGPVGTS